MTKTLTIVTLSDTHARHRSLDVPEGDILVHAGDITRRGDLGELADFDAFLAALPHRHKVVIAGNHDFCFERDPLTARSTLKHAIYLEDEAATIEGLRFWGSPWQPWFYDWAFNLERGPQIKEKWDLIPRDTDILVTHGPPYGQGDFTMRNESAGCEELLAAISVIKPRLHIFGHIHEGYGTTAINGTTFVNASNCTFDYEPVNPALVVRLTV